MKKKGKELGKKEVLRKLVGCKSWEATISERGRSGRVLKGSTCKMGRNYLDSLVTQTKRDFVEMIDSKKVRNQYYEDKIRKLSPDIETWPHAIDCAKTLDRHESMKRAITPQCLRS